MDREKIFAYVQAKYNTTPEKPWQEYPEYVVFRHQGQYENNKWYGIVMNVAPQKLGLKGNLDVDIIDLKCDTVLIDMLIDHQSFFPAYHMNKVHWLSVLINQFTPEAELFNLIDKSYTLT